MLANFFQFKPLPTNQIFGHYDLKLVVLSYLIAVIASYIALDIVVNMRHQKKPSKRFLWLLGGAFTMGGGVWSMHFVGMLSFDLTHIEMGYDLVWTLLSLFIAILSCTFALALLLYKVIHARQLILGGIFLGCAIASMHYTGMQAMRDHISINYRPLLFGTSVVIAIIALITALWLALKSSETLSHKRFKLKLISAIIMGTAICGMHYTGMASAVFTPNINSTHEISLNNTLLSITIATITFLILIIAFLFSNKATAIERLQKRLEHEKRSIEEALSNKLTFALDTAQFGSWDLNLLTNTLQRTLTHDQIYGYTDLMPEWTPKLFFQQVHPDDREMIKQKTKEAIKNNTILSGKFRIYRADDQSLRWVWARGKCININNTPHLVGLIQDITDSMQAEEKLRLSEERLSLLLNSTQEYAIYMITPDGIISYWNQAAENILGYKENEILGQNIEVLFSPQDQEEQHPQYIRKVARIVGRFEEKNWRMRKDGKRFYANVVYTRLVSNTGKVIGFCIITRDLTEQVMTEKKLRAISELRRSNQDLEQFAYIASHDLKAPLRAIKNLSTWIQKDKSNALSNASIENFTLLTERITRMERLIEDILQYSRAGLTDKEITTFELNNLLDEIVISLNPPKLFTFKFPEKAIILHTSRIQLSQVLCNLIDNAIKYHDRKDGHIVIGIENKNEFYEFSVSDDGPGIEKEFHHKIFELFQTLQSKDIVQSSGIGLAIVKKIVEMQGGEVTVESSPNTGTTFRFTWPKQPISTNADISNEIEKSVLV